MEKGCMAKVGNFLPHSTFKDALKYNPAMLLAAM